MTNELVTSQAAATDLVAAGEALYKSITGAEMSANQQKIADGITHIVDGLVPSLETRVSFDLKNVLAGATATLNGVAHVVTAAKTHPSHDNPDQAAA
ncbi:hypothetical protein CGLAMM_02905 [Acetobacteraceae bacterium EV16G]|uniref:Uncharacterized protein n=1 Tax=Sorlinia euscelidii TaxID=3081148 RepID=A0ABU7U0Z4_9PROT